MGTVENTHNPYVMTNYDMLSNSKLGQIYTKKIKHGKNPSSSEKLWEIGGSFNDQILH